MSAAGRFIVLEGPDGVGKSTQVALLAQWMTASGVPNVVTREPGGTPLGEAIRSLLLDRPELDVPAESELLLILAARAAFVRDVVRPALAEGKTVVADRFSLSTLAYQGYGRGLDLAQIRAGIEIATGGLRPDLCLLLDLPEDETRARRGRAGIEPDRIEAAGDGFRHAVREGYLDLVASEPGIEPVDARGTPEEVHERVRDRISARFPGTFHVTRAGRDS